jgi:hypothetical protein
LPHTQVKPQSIGQLVLVSLQGAEASQKASPQTQAWQSWGQLLAVSPHWAWQDPLPQAQVKPQSKGQLALVSPQAGSQKASPQAQGKQSCGQLF